eukprot:scaffold29389_cov68-Cyclotella_meneghiniana.AAC.3
MGSAFEVTFGLAFGPPLPPPLSAPAVKGDLTFELYATPHRISVQRQLLTRCGSFAISFDFIEAIQ